MTVTFTISYIFEAIGVGILCIILYEVLTYFIPIKMTSTFLFVHGFLKHLLGYILQIHTYYCNNGLACSKKSNTSNNYVASESLLELFIESMCEGLLFLIVGSTFYAVSPYLRNHKIVSIFLVGFFLHIAFEITGIHKLFCGYRCKQNVVTEKNVVTETKRCN